MAYPSGSCDAQAMQCLDGLSAEAVAERTGVDVSTARRWKARQSRLPKAAQLILEADLGTFARAWRGWKIKGEELISPEGLQIRMADVRAFPFMLAQISALTSENRRMRGLEDQADTGDIPAIKGAVVA